MKDVIIIGAGIIGGTVAYELSKFDVDALVIEKLDKPGLDVTGHNSAVVHAGVDPEEGTLKNKYNLLGTKMYEAYAKELGTPYKQIGAFLIATSDADNDAIEYLMNNAKNRDIFVERLNREEALQREPNLPHNVYEVLSMPTTAVVNPTDVAQKAIQKAQERGIKVHLEEEVVAINKLEEGFEVVTNKGSYKTRSIVNAAGLYTPHIEKMVSEPTFELTYIRGDYITLSKEARGMSDGALYPAPTNMGKGVLVIPQVDDSVLIGPTAFTITSLDETEITEADINVIKEKITMVAKEVPYEHQSGYMTGIRPKEVNNDFIIGESKLVPFFFNLAGTDSPGIVSAPAIADDFVNNMLAPRINIKKKD